MYHILSKHGVILHPSRLMTSSLSKFTQLMYKGMFTMLASGKIQEAMITENVLQGQKNHYFDSKINGLLQIKDTRSFYYSQVQKLQ